MIGDIADFLDFSEINLELKYRQELQDIRKIDENGELASEYREHLEEGVRNIVNWQTGVKRGQEAAMIESLKQ